MAESLKAVEALIGGGAVSGGVADSLDRTSSISPLVRLSSHTEEKSCVTCKEPVGMDEFDIRLGCRCLVHFDCLSGYIKSIITNRSSTAALNFMHKGIHCPNYNKVPAYNECMYSEGAIIASSASTSSDSGKAVDSEIDRAPSTGSLHRNISDGRRRMYFMRPPDLDQLLEISSARFKDASSTDTNALKFTEEEIEKLKGWLQEEDDDDSPQDNSIIVHTTKPCPRCKFPQSHFHGHKCHSVTCGRCRTQRCYKCNQTRCNCGGGYCTLLRGLADITDYLVLEPYPHDKRCGCAICFDCRPGKPCGTCEGGDCAVCRGYIQHGPQEVGDPWEPMNPVQRQAAEEYDRTHPVPRLNSRHREFFGAVIENDLKAVEEVLISPEGTAEVRLNRAGVVMTQDNVDGMHYCNRSNAPGLHPGGMNLGGMNFGDVITCSRQSRQCLDCRLTPPSQNMGTSGILRVSDPRDFNRTPLHLAASLGFSEMVIKLISHGASITAQDEFRMTPFCLSIVERRFNVLKTLVTHPKCVDAVANLRVQQGNIMHAVCANNLLDILKLICESDHPTFRELHRSSNNEGFTPLHMACRQPKSDHLIIYLLKKYEEFYRSRLEVSDNLIFDAMSYGNKKSATLILDLIASTNPRYEVSNETFDKACEQGYHDLVVRMLELGAVPKQNSVALASKSGKDVSFIKYLLDHDKFELGISEEQKAGDKPINFNSGFLNMAAASIIAKRVDILQAILEKFPFLIRIETDNYQEEQDSFQGHTRICGSLLNCACLHGSDDAAAFLLEKGAIPILDQFRSVIEGGSAELFSRYLDFFRGGFENPLTEDFESSDSSLEVTERRVVEIFVSILENSRQDMLRKLLSVSPVCKIDLFLWVIQKGYYDSACYMLEKLPSTTVKQWRGDISQAHKILLPRINSDPFRAVNQAPRGLRGFGVGHAPPGGSFGFGGGGAVISPPSGVVSFVSESLLEVACSRGSVELVKCLLKIGCVITQSAFMSAIETERCEILDSLLEKGVINETSNVAFTGPADSLTESGVQKLWFAGALEKACSSPKNTVSIITALLNAGAIIDDKDVAVAVSNGHFENLKALIDAGFCVNAYPQKLVKTSSSIYSPVQQPTNDLLVIGSRVDSRWKADNGIESLSSLGTITSINANGTYTVRFDDGVVSEQVPRNSIKVIQSPFGASTENVQFIVNLAPNPEKKIKSLLALAAKARRLDKMKLLLDRGHQISDQTFIDICTTLLNVSPSSVTPTTNACAILGLLLQYGVCCNVSNAIGETPLELALKNKHIDVARFLLDHGAVPVESPNRPKHQGGTKVKRFSGFNTADCLRKGFRFSEDNKSIVSPNGPIVAFGDKKFCINDPPGTSLKWVCDFSSPGNSAFGIGFVTESNMSNPHCITNSNPCGFLNTSYSGGTVKKIDLSGTVVTIRADTLTKNLTLSINGILRETVPLPLEAGYFGFLGNNNSSMKLVKGTYTSDPGGSKAIIDLALDCGSDDVCYKVLSLLHHSSNDKFKSNITPDRFSKAIRNKFVEATKLFLEAGFQPDMTAFFDICGTNCVPIAELLLDCGLCVNTVMKTTAGVYSTPLSVAILAKNVDMCKSLLNRGATILHGADLKASEVIEKPSLAPPTGFQVKKDGKESKFGGMKGKLKPKKDKSTVHVSGFSAPSVFTATSYTCPQGHTMTKLTGCPPKYNFHPYRGTCTCDACRKQNLQNTDYMHHCETCNYDLCSTCAPSGIQGSTATTWHVLPLHQDVPLYAKVGSKEVARIKGGYIFQVDHVGTNGWLKLNRASCRDVTGGSHDCLYLQMRNTDGFPLAAEGGAEVGNKWRYIVVSRDGAPVSNSSNDAHHTIRIVPYGTIVEASERLNYPVNHQQPLLGGNVSPGLFGNRPQFGQGGNNLGNGGFQPSGYAQSAPYNPVMGSAGMMVPMGGGSSFGGGGRDSLPGTKMPRLHIEIGWISETDASGKKVVELIPLVAPLRYKSTYFEGSNIRRDLEISSPILRAIPCGGVVDIAEKRWSEEPPGCCVPRARLLDNSGWTSFRLFHQNLIDSSSLGESILEYVGATPGVSGSQGPEVCSIIDESDSAARIFLNEIPIRVYQPDPLAGSSAAAGSVGGANATKSTAVIPSSLRNLMKMLVLTEPRLATFISPKSSRGLLHAALEYRDKEFIQFLLQHSTSIWSNAIVDYVKASAVMNGKSSSVQEHVGLITSLREKGAVLDELTICQALSPALISKDIPLVEALLNCGASLAKVDTVDIISHSIIDKCLNCGSVHIAERLVRSIPNIKAAVQQPNIDIVVSKSFDGLFKFFIESGINPKPEILYAACSNGSVEMVSILLDIGMDVSTVWLSPTSISYISPLIVAALFDKIDVCDLLIKRGARLLHQSAIPSSQIVSMSSMSISVADNWTRRLNALSISEGSQPKSNVILNRAGVEMKPGTGISAGINTIAGVETKSVYYCGRFLGVGLIPGSDGQCGPSNGPQCADCRAVNPPEYTSRGSENPVQIYDGKGTNDAYHICIRDENKKLSQEELCIQNRWYTSRSDGDTGTVNATTSMNCIGEDRLNFFLFSLLKYVKGNVALLKSILDAEPDILRLKSDNGESLLMMVLKEGRAVVHQLQPQMQYGYHQMQNTSNPGISADKLEKLYQTLELVLSYPTCEGYASSIQDFCRWKSSKKCAAIYRRLVEIGGDVQINIDTSTPIFLATFNFNVELVDLLLKDNVSVTAGVFFAPFEQLSNIAITSQQFADIFAITKLFVEKDSEIATFKNSQGESIVTVCCRLTQYSNINSLIDSRTIIIDFLRYLFTKVPGSAFNSDIFSLVNLRDEGLISTVISRGANLNEINPSTGSTVLIDFLSNTQYGHNETASEKFLRFLIDSGVDVNFYPLGPGRPGQHNHHQKSALYVAVNRNLDHLIRILEQAGARLLPKMK